MELIIYILNHVIETLVAAAPLILIYLEYRLLKLNSNDIGGLLLLNLIVSVFFWIKLRDWRIAIYQGVPYVIGYLCLFVLSLNKKNTK